MQDPIQPLEPAGEQPAHNPEPLAEEKPVFHYFPFFNRRQAVFVLAIIGIICSCTSLYNEYALDDGIIIHQNNYVLQGVKGIGDVVTHDNYDSFYKRMCATDQLQGGRYRPLAVASFALEQELIGPYRTGLYMKVEDNNKNGVLDPGPVSFTNNCGKPETNYEYNRYVDLNSDGKVQPAECQNCWDLNRNFKNDPSEDLNQDGIYNEVDCQVYRSPLRHFNNIWLYVLGGIALYLLLSGYLFKGQQDLAFLAALIFMAHPVHSSVVANIKSRDELLSLLFICLTFIYSFRYIQKGGTGTLFLGALMFLLALLSKEYGVVLLLLIPVAVHVFTRAEVRWSAVLLPLIAFLMMAGMMLFLDLRTEYFGLPPIVLFMLFALAYAVLAFTVFRHNFKLGGLHALYPMLCIAGLLYLALRLNAVNMAPGVPDTELLNNAYMLATPGQQFASKTYVLLKYLGLGLFPHPLLSDYSYASIPYRNLGDWDFILSAVLHLALLVMCVWLIIRRHFLGFALAFYFAFLLMICNYFIEIGTTMTEPCFFHSSVGLAIAMAWFILWAVAKLKLRRNALIAFLLVLTLLYGAKFWERNWDWKNDVTLFLKDVKYEPNSVLILGNAGARWIDLADTRQITGEDIPGINNVVNDYNGTLVITDEEMKATGSKTKREAALKKGMGYLERAVELHPRYVNGYLNLGLASYKLHDDKNAILYWKRAEALYPENPYLRNYYDVYSNQLKNRGTEAFDRGDYSAAVIDYHRWALIRPKEADAWYNLGGAYYNIKNYKKAREAWEEALKQEPGREDIRKLLDTMPGVR